MQRVDREVIPLNMLIGEAGTLTLDILQEASGKKAFAAPDALKLLMLVCGMSNVWNVATELVLFSVSFARTGVEEFL